MARSKTPRVQVAFRLPQDVFDMLPPPSLNGERVDFVIAAIREYHAKCELLGEDPPPLVKVG